MGSGRVRRWVLLVAGLDCESPIIRKLESAIEQAIFYLSANLGVRTIDDICASLQKHAENYPVKQLEREWLLSDETPQLGLATLKDWALAETRLLRTQAEELMSWRRMGWCLEPVFGHNLLDIVRDIECTGKPVYVAQTDRQVHKTDRFRSKIKSIPDGNGFGTGPFRDPALTKMDERAMDILTRSRLGRYRMQWVLVRVEALFGHFLLLVSILVSVRFHVGLHVGQKRGDWCAGGSG